MRISCFLALMFIAPCIYGQFVKIELKEEVLQQRLQRSLPDTERVQDMVMLGRRLMFRPSVDKGTGDSASLVLDQAMRIARRRGYKRGEGQVLLAQAMVCGQKQQWDQFRRLEQQALAIFTGIGDLEGQADYYYIFAGQYKNSGSDLGKKLDCYQKAVPLFRKAGALGRAGDALTAIGDLQLLSHDNQAALVNLQAALANLRAAGREDLTVLYDLMGYCFTFMDDYINGMKYELMAVESAERQKDTSLILCTIYNRLAAAYYVSRQYKESLASLDKALAIARKYRNEDYIANTLCTKISTLVRTYRAAEALPLINELSRSKATADEVGRCQVAELFIDAYTQLRKPDSARPWFELLSRQSIDHFADPYTKMLIQNGLAVYYFATRQYDRAHPLFLRMDSIARGNQLPFYQAVNHLKWARNDSALGNYLSAYRHFQQYKLINDSMFSAQRTRLVASLQIQHETREKEDSLLLQARNIQLLRQQSELDQAQVREARTTRNVLLGGSALLLLVLGLGINRYRLKQRGNRLLQERQAEIDRQNHFLQDLTSQQNILLNEKEWLLREIHHRVKNNLQVTISLLNIQSAYLSNEAAQEAIRNSQRRMQTMSLIHQKLYQSENLARINMLAYIRELVSYLRESFGGSRNVSFQLDTDPVELDVAQAVPVGLILNEAITNAIKYAFPGEQAGLIHVILRGEPGGNIALVIADNGAGWQNGTGDTPPSSLGINLMKGLAGQLQGSFCLCHDNGTRIEVHFKQVLNMMQEHEK